MRKARQHDPQTVPSAASPRRRAGGNPRTGASRETHRPAQGHSRAVQGDAVTPGPLTEAIRWLVLVVWGGFALIPQLPATDYVQGFEGQHAEVAQWRPLVAEYFPAEEVGTALCIMYGESRGNPNAASGTGAEGLMQVLQYWKGPAGVTDHFDVNQNMHAARYVWDIQGWRAWNVYRRGSVAARCAAADFYAVPEKPTRVVLDTVPEVV